MKSLIKVAHAIWQCLPPGPRQRFYETITLAMAPKAPADGLSAVGWQPPFVVAGALSAPTGLGESARLLLNGLRALGFDAAGIDLSSRLMQPSSVEVDLRGPVPIGPGTMLLVVQPPNVGMALRAVGMDAIRQKRIVGHWVWDLDEVPFHWTKSLAYVHDLAAPSKFCADIFSRAFDRPVSVLSYPVALQVQDLSRKQSGPMVFGAAFDLGSTVARKNPMAALTAFECAFAPGNCDVRFEIKVRGESADPRSLDTIRRRAAPYGGQIVIRTGNMSVEELDLWWRDIDVFVNLHRSEGFGLLVAEAMLRGIPVIATNWAATSEYVDHNVGWPISYDMIPVHDQSGKYISSKSKWADARIEHAAEAMRAAVREGRGEIENKGKAAIDVIASRFGLESFSKQLRIGAGDA